MRFNNDCRRFGLPLATLVSVADRGRGRVSKLTGGGKSRLSLHAG